MLGSRGSLVFLTLVALALFTTNGAGSEEVTDDCGAGGEGCSEGEGLVVELTDEDFMETVQQADMMVVQFYTPW